MPNKIKSAATYLPHRLNSVVNLLLRDEAISGKILLAAALLALIVVNSPLLNIYESFWHTNLSIGLGEFSLSEDLRHWMNDGLMVIFFLVVGLEIKREMVKGELRNPKKAILPIAAAVGGMIVPVLIYLVFNFGSETARGWGIPVATDIAFAIGVLALIGSRVPSSLKVFLLTLAIVDDLLAILIIAIFYTAQINQAALAAAFAIIAMLLVSRKLWPNSIVPYVVLGACLWAALHKSGIHPTIAGALVGFLAPLKAGDLPSIAERLETAMIPISTFVVIPLFAFANSGVVFSGISFTSEINPILAGTIFGLVLGKPLGVLAVAFLLTKFNIATLPKGVTWGHMLGVGLLAGIGFTVSIFITELAFVSNQQYISAAKVGIIIASVLAAVAGALTLILQRKKTSPELSP